MFWYPKSSFWNPNQFSGYLADIWKAFRVSEMWYPKNGLEKSEAFSISNGMCWYPKSSFWNPNQFSGCLADIRKAFRICYDAPPRDHSSNIKWEYEKTEYKIRGMIILPQYSVRSSSMSSTSVLQLWRRVNARGSSINHSSSLAYSSSIGEQVFMFTGATTPWQKHISFFGNDHLMALLCAGSGLFERTQT